MVIGVTGGIGSGKSTFVKALEELGCYIINADELGKELVDSDEQVRSGFRESFGDSIFDNQENLKRRDLGRLVFSDSESLKKLNDLVQEPLLKKIRLAIQKFHKNNKTPIVLDMATLFETNAADFCDQIIVITAPVEKRVQWFIQSKGWTDQEIRNRIKSQLPDTNKIQHAHIVIENDSTIASLENKAKSFFGKNLTVK